MYKYALILNNLMNNDVTQIVLTELLNSKKDVTIFVLNKNNIVANPFPVFNIADLWNWRGVTITTSQETLEKANKYPLLEPIVSLPSISKEIFNLEAIEKEINDYYVRNK